MASEGEELKKYNSSEGMTTSKPPEDIDSLSKDTKPSESSPEGLLSGKKLAGLLLGYLALIVLGGVIFHFIEYTTEQDTVNQSAGKVIRFLDNNTCVSPEELSLFIRDVIDAYNQGVTLSNDTEEHDSSWDIPTSMFFSTTIVTTIGYGNISPATVGGRVFTVFYALIGIPVFIITSGQLGMRLSRFSERITNKAVKRVSSHKWRAVLSVLLVFLIGFSLFSLCAAGVFTAVEGWAYGDSMYYTFITLTTIGFGDFYPGFAGDSNRDSVGRGFYRVFVSLWIIFGLVWMASTLSAIADTISKVIASKATAHHVNADTTTPELKKDESEKSCI